MLTYIAGTQLNPAAKRHALARYVHRYTGTHKPAWARQPRPDGTAYPVQFTDDFDWLAHTRFAVTKAGNLDNRASYCESNPTWPANPELRQPAA